MTYIIEGGASDTMLGNKKQIISSMTKEDRDFISSYGRELINANRTKYGETKGALGRRVAVIPYDLMAKIEKIDPEVFKNKKKLNKFLVEFPIFRGSEKI